MIISILIACLTAVHQQLNNLAMALSIRFRGILLFLFLLVFSSFHLFAQFEVNWDRSYGGQGDENLVEIIRLDNGDYLLAGTSVSPVSGTKTAAPKGWMDYYVIRINAQGDIIWDRTFGGDKKDELTSAILTSSGDILLAGHSTSGISGDKSEANRGDADYWIVMIDPDGNKLWDRTYGGDGDDFLKQVIEAPGGGYVLGGISFSGMSGEKSELQKRPGIGFHSSDNWILRVNANGSKRWDRTLGGDEADSFEIMKYEGNTLTFFSIYWDSYDRPELGNSDIIFTGLNFSAFGGIWMCELNDLSGNINYQNHTGINAYGYGVEKILSIESDSIRVFQANYDEEINIGDQRYNPKEITEYSREFPVDEDQIYGGDPLPGLITDYAEFVQQSGSRVAVYELYRDASSGNTDLKLNNLILGGSSNEKDPVIKWDNKDGFIVGSTSSSNSASNGYKSQDSFGGSDFWIVKVAEIPPFAHLAGMDSVTSIVETSDNGYLVIGASDSDRAGIKSENSKGGLDYWIVKFNSNSKVEWERTIGGSEDDIPVSAIEFAEDGPFYVIAGYSQSNMSGDKTSGLRGSSDLWVVRLDATGNLVWDEVFGGLNEEYGGYLIHNRIGANNLTYLLGSSNSSAFEGLKSTGSHGGFDYWLLAIDPEDGMRIWDKNYGTENDDFAEGLNNSGDEFFLSGSTYRNLVNSLEDYEKNPSEVLIYRTTIQGTLRSTVKIRGAARVRNVKTEPLPDGKYLVGLSSFSWNTEQHLGGYDFRLIKLDMFNKIIWDETFGTTDNDYLLDFESTRDGYILSGYTDIEKLWVVKLDKHRETVLTKEYSDHIGGYFSRNENNVTVAGTAITGDYNYSTFKLVVPENDIVDEALIWARDINPTQELFSFNGDPYISTVERSAKGLELNLARIDEEFNVLEEYDHSIESELIQNFDGCSGQIDFKFDKSHHLLSYIGMIDCDGGFEIGLHDTEGILQWKYADDFPSVLVEKIYLDFKNNDVVFAFDRFSYYGPRPSGVIVFDSFGAVKRKFDIKGDLIDFGVTKEGYIALLQEKRQSFIMYMDFMGNEVWRVKIDKGTRISITNDAILIDEIYSRSNKRWLRLYSFSLSGQLNWMKEYLADGIGNYGIYPEADGLYLVGNWFGNSNDIIGNWNRGSYDVFISSLNYHGEIQGNSVFGSSNSDQIPGHFISIGTTPNPLQVYLGDEYFLLRTVSNSGVMNYEKITPGVFWDYAYNPIANIWGGYHWVLKGHKIKKSDLPSAIMDNSLNPLSRTMDTKLYPNPADDILWVGYDVSEEQVNISDLAGRIYKLDIRRENGRIRVETSPLASGIYLLTVRSAEGNETYRFVKE